MYAGRVAVTLPLVSHSKYAIGTDRQMDEQMDGRQTVTLRIPLWTRPTK